MIKEEKNRSSSEPRKFTMRVKEAEEPLRNPGSESSNTADSSQQPAASSQQPTANSQHAVTEDSPQSLPVPSAPSSPTTPSAQPTPSMSSTAKAQVLQHHEVQLPDQRNVARLGRMLSVKFLNVVGLLSMYSLKIGYCGVDQKKKLFWVKVKCCLINTQNSSAAASRRTLARPRQSAARLW